MVYPLTVPFWNSLLPSWAAKKSNEVISTCLLLLPRCMFQSGMICLLTIPLWNSPLFPSWARTRHFDSPWNVLCRWGSKHAHLLTEISTHILTHKQDIPILLGMFCVAKAPNTQRTLVTTTIVCVILSIPICCCHLKRLSWVSIAKVSLW